jgi:hypothetical protein
MEGPGVASCILAEAKFYGGDSSIPRHRTVTRTLQLVELGSDGRIYERARSADWPYDLWYYICFGPPQMGSIPVCA